MADEADDQNDSYDYEEKVSQPSTVSRAFQCQARRNSGSLSEIKILSTIIDSFQ